MDRLVFRHASILRGAARGGRASGQIRRSRTHCIHGHEFTPANTRVTGRQRKCLTCERRTQRARVR